MFSVTGHRTEGTVDKHPFEKVFSKTSLPLAFYVAVWESVQPSCQQSTEAFQRSLLHLLSSSFLIRTTPLFLPNLSALLLVSLCSMIHLLSGFYNWGPKTVSYLVFPPENTSLPPDNSASVGAPPSIPPPLQPMLLNTAEHLLCPHSSAFPFFNMLLPGKLTNTVAWIQKNKQKTVWSVTSDLMMNWSAN